MDPKALRAELLTLRSRLRRLFALYGSLRLVAIVAACLAAVYMLDRSLSLPAGVRLVMLLITAGVAGWAAYRGVVYPLRRQIRAGDVACAIEERFPEFDGRLISTLELEGEALAPDRNISVDLVDVLRAETGRMRRDLRFERIFDYRILRRVAALAVVLLALDVGFAVLEPGLTGIFLNRLFGGAARWPQKVFLNVEFPEQAEHFSVEYEDGHPVSVRIARGASLPVTVRADGERPEFVELKTRDVAAGGRVPAVLLSPTAGEEWVGRFRNVREPFTFWPHDGDVNDDGRDVAVEVFQSPGVARVQTTLTFPEYTGLETRQEPRGDVEAPVGTRVDLEVAVDGEVASGRLVFDVNRPEVALTRSATAAAQWVASFEVVESCSYVIHLVGENGFRNLEPASYAVIAVADRPPTVRLIEPALAAIDVTPVGVVPFRVAADDDYAVAKLILTMAPFGGAESSEFDLLAAAAADAAAGPSRRQRRLTYTLLDLARTPFPHVDGVRGSQAGDSYIYRIAGEDNHAGEVGPNRTTVTDRRVDVVSVNEKLRLLTERQMRYKDDVRALRDLQAEKRTRLLELLADYESSEGDATPDVGALGALEIGQNQVTNRSVRLSRDFADLFEEYLFNRLDRSAAAERVIPLLAERKQASDLIDGFDFAIYRPIADAYASGSFGQLDVLGRLLDMLTCILDVAETLSPEAGRSLSDARLAVDAQERPAGIRAALAAQEQALARIDLLLEKMDEWEDFQEILMLFRDLLEDQRDLNARTRDSLRSGEGR